MKFKAATAIFSFAALFAFQYAQAFDGYGYAELQIVEPINIVEDQSVQFGPMLQGESTCTMASDGALTSTTGGGCLNTSGTPGQVTVTGTPGSNVQINLLSGPAINNVTFTPVASISSGSLGGDGKLTFAVYGTIEQAADAAAGATSIQYTIAVTY